ncbi:MAG: response regulator [Treponema sp.]|nr:response regulator [Treponema sp.]
MITIVIADDEKLIRAGIRKILTDNLGKEINVFEAKNGKEALELCQSENPDVLITDIKMPVMDGLELMGKVSELPKKIGVIVLSGFDDFNYAKTAISCGVLAYVLKPVDSKELISAVNQALSSARKIEQTKNEETLRSIMIDGHLPNDEMFKMDNFPDGFYCVSIAGFHCTDAVISMENKNLFYVIEQKRDLIILIVPDDNLFEFKNPSFSKFIIGVSVHSKSITDLRKLKSQSFAALLQSFFVANTRSKVPGIYYAVSGGAVSDFTESDGRYEKFTAALDLLSTEEIKKALNSLFDFSNLGKEKSSELLFYNYNKILNNLFKRYPKFHDTDTYLYLKSLMIENIEQTECFEEWKRYVIDYTLYLTELLKRQQGKYPYVTKAIAYVNKHYSENITMATVANYVSMNYTWFSEKFKEQVGLNFNDYLKKFRMEQAKHLLEMGTYKVYEVAEKTGFKDVKHFMKSFREMNGMSAGEWARVHGNTLDD